MQCQIRHLIRYAKAQGCVMSVHDGEEWAVKKSTNEADIMDAINQVEEATIRIRNAAGDVVGSAFVIPELDKDERVADHSVNAFMDAWSEDYDRANAA